MTLRLFLVHPRGDCGVGVGEPLLIPNGSRFRGLNFYLILNYLISWFERLHSVETEVSKRDYLKDGLILFSSI